MSLEDEEGFELKKRVINPEIIQKVNEVVLRDQRLKLSIERLHKNFHVEFGISTLSARV